MTNHQYLRLLLTQYILELEEEKDDHGFFALMFEQYAGRPLLTGDVFYWRQLMNNNEIYSIIRGK